MIARSPGYNPNQGSWSDCPHLAALLGAMKAWPAACAAVLCAVMISATTRSKYEPSAVVDSGYTASTSQEPVLHRNTPSIWNLYFCARHTSFGPS